MVDLLHLRKGPTLLGVLQVNYVDQPWFFCGFQPTKYFAAYKPLFDKELEIDIDKNLEAWEEIQDQIDELGLSLIDIKSNQVIKKFIMHIEDGEASFRY